MWKITINKNHNKCIIKKHRINHCRVYHILKWHKIILLYRINNHTHHIRPINKLINNTWILILYNHSTLIKIIVFPISINGNNQQDKCRNNLNTYSKKINNSSKKFMVEVMQIKNLSITTTTIIKEKEFQAYQIPLNNYNSLFNKGTKTKLTMFIELLLKIIKIRKVFSFKNKEKLLIKTHFQLIFWIPINMDSLPIVHLNFNIFYFFI